MQQQTTARMWVLSSKVRIGAGMTHGQRRGELGEGVVLGAGERGSPRWPAIATKTYKGDRTCGNLTYCALRLRVAAAA